MKLLVFTDQMAFLEGGEYFCTNPFFLFATKLGSYFEEVTILSCLTRGAPQAKSLVKIPLDQGGRVRIEGTYPFFSYLEYYKKLFRVLPFNIPVCARAVKGADAVYMRLPAALNAAIVVASARIYNKPVIAQFSADEKTGVEQSTKYRGILRPLSLLTANFHRIIWRYIISRSRASIFLSEDLRRRLASTNDRAFTTFVSLVEHIEDSPRMDLPHPGNPVNLLYVGRLAQEKGLLYLLEAADSLHREGFPLRLLLCGEGYYKARLEQTVREKGLESFVEFLGFVPWGEPQWDLYRRAHVFVLPSITEGTPKVLLEAMSRGVPIVASDVGGVGDVILNMENGILVPPRSAAAIARAVKLIAEDDRIRRRIIANGLTFAEQHTISKQSERVAKIIYQHASAARQ